MISTWSRAAQTSMIPRIIGDAYRVSVTSSETNPTAWVRPVRRLRAVGSGRYCSSAAAARMRSAVASAIRVPGRLVSTKLAVVLDTPARLATSASVARRSTNLTPHVVAGAEYLHPCGEC